jgi:hypothetical protein
LDQRRDLDDLGRIPLSTRALVGIPMPQGSHFTGLAAIGFWEWGQRFIGTENGMGRGRRQCLIPGLSAQPLDANVAAQEDVLDSVLEGHMKSQRTLVLLLALVGIGVVASLLCLCLRLQRAAVT